MQEKMKKLHHYKFIHFMAHHVVSPLLLKKYNFKTDKVKKMKEPFICVSNHTTEADMMMVQTAIRPHFFFVCGEHLFRSKWGPIVVRNFNPIPEWKGSKATKTVIEIIRRIKNGHSIMIFPEGNRSFNGETVALPVSIGKLVKKSGAALITYKIIGGYFVGPRWGYKARKGKMEGKVMGVYSSADLAKMTNEEITDIINRDIYEHAYNTQREKMYTYECNGLAEGIENYLVMCPNCHGYDTFTSSGDTFTCSKCGEKATYDKYGFIHSDKFKFDNVYDWGKWIEVEFDKDMATKASDEHLFTDHNLSIYQITADHQKIDIDQGTMEIYKDRMVFGDKTFMFKDIVAMSMLYFGKTLLFTHDNINYGITGEGFHAWKYDRLYHNQKNSQDK